MRVSTETIYQALYVQARGGLKQEVSDALRTGRVRRKPRRSPEQRRERFKDPMVMISERPAEIEDRAVPGHWEGDLITGEKKSDRDRDARGATDPVRDARVSPCGTHRARGA